MNRKNFESIYKYYKKNFREIGKEELYKWEAVAHFQKYWDMESADFPEMLKTALYKTHNLLDAGKYFPNRMLCLAAEREPGKVKKTFEYLFDLTLDLEDRILGFRKSIDEIISKHELGDKSYQDDRAILVYLNMRYPDKYYLYKFTMFKDFVELVDYDYVPKKGNIDNIFVFEKLCEYILERVLCDRELLGLYAERKKKYIDPEYHLLVQDIIYSVHYYSKKNNKLMEDEREKIEVKDFNLYPKKQKINLCGTHIDYIEVEKKNKRIGAAGERFVYDYERKIVEEYKLPKTKTVRHISKLDGDGFGYDILSYDENGNEKYIEVKTTVNSENSSFFITANELAKSEESKENYYLYRVYCFDVIKEIGNISIKKGSLKDLCIEAHTYKVDF